MLVSLVGTLLMVSLASCSTPEQAETEVAADTSAPASAAPESTKPRRSPSRTPSTRKPTAPAPATQSPSPTAAVSPTAVASAETSSGPPGAPAQIRIPSIGVVGPVGLLGLLPDGALDVPRDPSAAGWWKGGSAPGEVGPAVIVAHRDSAQGPALFYQVPELEAGAQIIVDVAGGGQQVFVVDRVELHDKEQFPTMAVYGSTPEPTLRLLTCGGDYGADGYKGNYVVFAHQLG